MRFRSATYTIFILAALFLLPGNAWAQNKNNLAKKDFLQKGNKMYKKAEYELADSLYLNAIAVDTTYAAGWYNLGNSLYLGGDGDKAKSSWTKSLMNTPEGGGRSDILYNLGGVEMDKKNYAEAIKLYKDALRRNPADEQARYNLALAQQLLKDQQNPHQQQPNQNQNQDQNKDNNQDNKDQNKDNNQDNKDQNKDNNQDNKDQNKDNNQDNNDQNKDNNQDNNDQNKDNNQDNKDQNKDNNPNNQGGGSSGQNTPQKLSQSDEQMLRAIDRQEQGTQEKVKGEKTGGAVIHTTKDW